MTGAEQGPRTARRPTTSLRERAGLAAISVVSAVAIAEVLVRLLGIETDLVRSRSASVAIPARLLANPNWVSGHGDRVFRSEPIPSEQITWLGHFEEARWVHFKARPHLDVLAVNPFNATDVERSLTFRIRTSGDGFRTHELSDPRPGAIVALGDSSTFGWGVDDDDTYPRLLEERLRRRGRETRVYNLGIPGQTTEHGLAVLRHYGAPLAPSVVIVSFGANDGRPGPLPARQLLAAYNGIRGATRFALLRLRSYRLLRRLVLELADPMERLPRAGPGTYPPIVPVDEYRQNLLTMASAAPRAVFVCLCSSDERYVMAMRDAARELGAPFVDTEALFLRSLPALRDGRLYPELVAELRARYGAAALERTLRLYVTTDGCHPNPVGMSLVADALAEALAPEPAPRSEE